MKLSRTALALWAGLAGSTVPGHAALRWEHELIAVKAEPTQKVLRVAYRFQNVGDRPVTLVSLEASCRCVAPEIAKSTYAPGEKGELIMAFTIGPQTGLQQKSVLVTTDEGQPVPVRLVLQVTLPGS